MYRDLLLENIVLIVGVIDILPTLSKETIMGSEREIVERLRNPGHPGILPVQDKDTIIRSEHHPVSTADKPNVDGTITENSSEE